MWFHSCESHQNERDAEVVQVWDYTIKDDFNELIDTTYTNKMYLLFGSLSINNSKIKCNWLGVGWVTFWEVSHKTMWVRTKHAVKSRVGL